METRVKNIVENGKIINDMNIALQAATVGHYEYLINKKGRTDLLQSWGEQYERLQLLKSGAVINL